MGVSIIPSYLGNFGAFEMPGTATDIGRNLAELGGGIAHLIDPELEFHGRLREALAANPELMERFADFSSQNPEAFAQMSHMLPRDVLAAVRQTKPSFRAIEEGALRRAAPSVLGKPESQQPTDMTPEQLGVYRRVAGGEPGQAGVREVQGAQARDALAFYNSAPPEIRRHLAAEGYIPGLRMQEEMAFRQQMMEERDKDRIGDYAHELRLRSAAHMASLYGGTDEEWDQYMHNADMQQRARDLISGKIPATSQQDQRIMQMEHNRTLPIAQRELGITRGQLAERALHLRTMESLLDRIEGTNRAPPADEQAGKALIQPLQEEIDQVFGPSKFKAVYGQAHALGINIGLFAHGPRVQIVDQSGNEVPNDILRDLPLDFSQVNTNLVGAKLQNPKAKAVWDRIVQSRDIEGGLQALYDQEVKGMHTPVANSLWLEIINAARR